MGRGSSSVVERSLSTGNALGLIPNTRNKKGDGGNKQEGKPLPQTGFIGVLIFNFPTSELQAVISVI